MPVNEAIFWFGMTVVGAGAYILWDRHLKNRWWSALLLVLGILAVLYSVYSHSHPEAKLPNPPVWIYLLVTTWCALGYVVFDRKRNSVNPPKNPPPPAQNTSAAASENFDASLQTRVKRGSESAGGEIHDFVTSGNTEPVEINLGITPSKLYFESAHQALERKDLPKELEINGRPLQIVWYTNNGLVINDHGAKLAIRLTVLEGIQTLLTQSLQDSQPLPELTPTETEIVRRTENTYNLSKWATRVALREVYRQPGIDVQQILSKMEELGFDNVQAQIINPLLATGLIRRHDGTLTPNQDPLLRKTVERLLTEQAI